MKSAGANVRSLSDAKKKRNGPTRCSDIPNEQTAEINKAGQPGKAVGEYIKDLKAAGVKLPRDWIVK